MTKSVQNLAILSSLFCPTPGPRADFGGPEFVSRPGWRRVTVYDGQAKTVCAVLRHTDKKALRHRGGQALDLANDKPILYCRVRR